MHMKPLAWTLCAAGLAVAVTLQAQQERSSPPPQGDRFRFRSGIELINVTATVSDASGRFVPGLRREDFLVYDDDQQQTITHFSADRVPVSLGVLVDTSASMAGEKIRSARSALNRLFALMEPEDEIFLYEFNDRPMLLQEWTSDRTRLARAVRRLTARGGTAMYDAVAEAAQLAESGTHQKRALVLLSDGNDTASRASVRELIGRIRESEVLVYAIGFDATTRPSLRRQPLPPRQPPIPIPRPFPPGRWPGGGRIPDRRGVLPQIGGWPGQSGLRVDDRLNVAALREITDASGGRIEIVRDGRDLDVAASSIADELSQQYYLAYPAGGTRDGRWHSIRVEVRKGGYRVRARQGYAAS